MSDNDPVVIVGLAIEAPGGVETADDYWTLLSEQREGLGPFPTDRGWALRELFDGSRRNGFKPIHNLGGFLSSATTFDPEFFRISPREATAMDPQQRVGLRVAWRTLENSGINPDDLAGHDVGCYVGASALEYGPALTEFSHHSGHLITGTSLGVISGRIAYTLDLAGPALTVDTSCSSALAAFHRGSSYPGRRLRPGTRRRRVRDGYARLFRRVLQAARAIRRRPLPALQRARQRNRLGRGRRHVPPAAPVAGNR